MKKYLFLIIISITFSICAQVSGEIIYSKEIKVDIEHEKLGSMVDLIKKANNIAKDFEFILKFNNHKSSFTLKEILELGNSPLFGFANLNSTGIFYSDIKSDISIHQREFGGDMYLIKGSSKNIEWELINETKKIGKYNCSKAIIKKKIENGKDEFRNEDIVVWYTPEINVNFGPIGYGNLPGLILELEFNKYKGNNKLVTKFVAQKIKLNTKNTVNIKPPTKGIKISKKEFDKMLNQPFKM